MEKEIVKMVNKTMVNKSDHGFMEYIYYFFKIKTVVYCFYIYKTMCKVYFKNINNSMN